MYRSRLASLDSIKLGCCPFLLDKLTKGSSKEERLPHGDSAEGNRSMPEIEIKYR